MNRFLEVYWIIYFLGYLIAVAVMLWLRWDGLIHGDNRIHLLAAIYGTAAGSASAFAILVEGGGRIVLLIPAEVNRLMEKGRKEGRQEGREEGHLEREARYAEAYRRFGVEVDGVVMLPRTPEVQAFLDGQENE